MMCVSNLVLLMILVFSPNYCESGMKKNLLQIRQNTFGEDYGKKWMYFPDGEGIMHVVNLTESDVMSPSYRIENDLEFKLYSKELRDEYLLLDESNQPHKNESFITNILSKAPLKMITHGWMASADSSAVMGIAQAYLKASSNVNVITLDWSTYSKNMNYPLVAKQTREVGLRVASFLIKLSRRYNLNGNYIHLIGHSLGAHVMGISGYESNLNIGRITGLDPALPLFSNIQTTKTRLDYNDAKFVDIIHTCGGILGFWDAIGTADFYPNKGLPPQPGCSLEGLMHLDACSHSRSHIYYAESILNPKAFPSYQCDVWMWTDEIEKLCSRAGYMGEGATVDMTGKYFLFTNSYKPYGRSI